MTTDLKRLRTWMRRTGHDSHSLNHALGYEVDMVGRTVAGKIPVGRTFRRLFARRFGEPLAFALFDNPIPHNAIHTGQGMHPERDAARNTMQLKRNRELVPPAKLFKCLCCDKQAVHNHHPSYEPENHLRVIPLCRSCHVRVHKGSLTLDLGIQPIRLAIAGLE